MIDSYNPINCGGRVMPWEKVPIRFRRKDRAEHSNGVNGLRAIVVTGFQ